MRKLSHSKKWFLPAPLLPVLHRQKLSGGNWEISSPSRGSEVWSQSRARRVAPKKPPSPISSGLLGRSPGQRKTRRRSGWRSTRRRMKRRKRKLIPVLLLERQLYRRRRLPVTRRWGARQRLPAELSERGNPSLSSCCLDQQQQELPMPETPQRWTSLQFNSSTIVVKPSECHSCSADFRNSLKASTALSRNSILCFSALGFPSLHRETHRCVNAHASIIWHIGRNYEYSSYIFCYYFRIKKEKWKRLNLKVCIFIYGIF